MSTAIPPCVRGEGFVNCQTHESKFPANARRCNRWTILAEEALEVAAEYLDELTIVGDPTAELEGVRDVVWAVLLGLAR